ncbi:armadillo-type protein [Hygrophoropsis aurantiaca]|uniref:Armadillo-type protein n=1 Tax=Hygrophoropsis aurantiaca TaxID=72124 RepID=A0ACB8A857_9AGAM|nr:armadillo-type protein [Hygrophoropsis aurantiaca]
MDQLVQTWTAIRDAIPACNSEVQRATAEVWGSVLRRLKSTAREKAVTLMAESVDEVEDASAWMIVFACKSVSQTLHTTTPTVMAPLIDFYLGCDTPEAMYGLLRRVLTALIHHCKGPEQFSPVADLVVERFSVVAKLVDPIGTDQERLRRVVQITSVICAVRQGSRMSPNQLTRLASGLSGLHPAPALHGTFLEFSTSLLTAGDMSLSTGPGRAFLLRAFETPSFGILLCGALFELGWGGWKLIALPALLKSTPMMLNKEPKQTLRLLACLRRAGKLGEVDAVWRHTVGNWVQDRLAHWEKNPERVDELVDILALAEYVPSFSQLIIQIVDGLLDSPDPEGDWTSTHANAAWIIGACIHALAENDPESWGGQVDLNKWAKKIMESWSWSELVLQSFVLLLKIRPAKSTIFSFSDLYPYLKSHIISHSRSLRLSAMKLLSSSFVQSSPGEQEVLKRCLQGEEVSLDVHGVRERVLRIGRVGQVVKEDEPLAADLCVRWLLSQLKVNLRPIWSPASEAVSSLAPRFDHCVWELVFFELQSTSDHGTTKPAPEWLKESSNDQNNADDPWEDERSWRDPSAHKLRFCVSKWLSDDLQRKSIIHDQKPSGRFDAISYENQLLGTLGQCSSLAEKHNRDLVPLFLALVDPTTENKMARHQLQSWLTLFSKFNNPKALHSTEELYALYHSLLSHPDRSLQTASLSCLLTYKSPHLVPHEGMLRLLLDDTRWRDELTSLDISAIEAQDRPHLVDAVVRILFGLMLERKGGSRGAGRRAAVLSSLAGCTDDELSLLTDLMLKPMHSDHQARRAGAFELHDVPSTISLKQQTGFLTLLGDVLRNLGPRTTSYWPALLGSTLDLVAHAQQPNTPEEQGDTSEENPDDEEEGDDEADETPSKSMRSVRQLGLKRLADFFRSPVTFDFSPYLVPCFGTIISPRLAVLDKENTQAPSALLDMFYTWASRPEYVRYLVQYDPQVLPKVYACLVAINVKATVLTRIFDLIDRLLLLTTEDPALSEVLIKPHVSLLLGNLAILVQRTKGEATISSPLAQRQISILSDIACHISDPSQAFTLFELLSPLLRKPGKIISEKTKINLLKIMGSLFSLIPELSDRFSGTYTKLFLVFRSSQGRTSLSLTFTALAAIDVDLQPLASLLEALNAYSTKRMNEPDFDRRLTAFASLNDHQYSSLSSRDWLPVVYNMLHFIQDPDELAVRNNAAFAFRRLVDIVAEGSSAEYETLFMRTVFPGLKKALRSKHELVRADVLSVIAYAIAKCEHIETLQEMRPLLASGDEEASFFSNIHHIQVHRRTRALRRLAEQCDEGCLRSRTLAEIFLPLVEHYVISTAALDHHLVTEAINTLGRIAKHLAWGVYHTLVQKYLRSSKEHDDAVRVHVRALVTVLENFHFAMEEVAEADHAEADEDDEENEVTDRLIPPPPPAADVKKIADAVNLRLLPSLLQYLEKRDETEDTLRIPISVGIVHVATHLPEATREAQISKLLTVLSQVLRSRSQETRDLTRDTLCRIAIMLGPSYLPAILREMRAALLRGPQLHVLAYVTHALLTHTTSAEHAATFHDLSACVPDIAHIAAEVIFGESGKDVQSEDFKTKMREVRAAASKGLDAFAITARYIAPAKISGLLLPLRGIMCETSALKTMQQVEEVLRRIASGLNANSRLTPAELLVLCHTLISQNARFLQEVPAPSKANNTKGKKNDAIVQMKRKVVVETDHYANNSFRFIVFGLELFNTAFRRSRFDFHDASIIARLEPMVKLIGNTLYSNSQPVLTAGIKAAAAILKCPLKSTPKSAPIITRQILSIIKNTGSAESDVAQTALKSLATILRDCPAAQPKETDLVFLLALITPDLEDPARQAAVFALLRAIVARRLVVPEIYDLMDRVGEVLVTSQSAAAQEQARGVLLQFLLDYPQGKGRLKTQMGFLAQNLAYTHESGRRSVLALLGAVLAKFEAGLVREYADMLFVALVMVLANDDSAGCRETAGELVKALLARVDGEGRKKVVEHLRAWAGAGQVQLVRVAMQVYGLVLDVLQRDTEPYIRALLDDVNAALERSVQQLSQAHGETDRDGESTRMEIDLDWQVPYQSLIALSKVLRVFPEYTTDGVVSEPTTNGGTDGDGGKAKITWAHVTAHLLFPHAWVRTAACRLVGVLFAAVPVAPPREASNSTDNPLSTRRMRAIAEKLALQLKSEHLDEPLSLQIVKNLFYIGKCFYAVPPRTIEEDGREEDANDEDGGQEEDGDGGQEDDDDEGGEIESAAGAGQAATPQKRDKRTQTHNDPLPWLFSKLSYQARSAHIARRNRSRCEPTWHHQPTSIFRWFAAMASHMSPARLRPFLPHILAPLYRVAEDDTIRDAGMDGLKTLTAELTDLLQTRLGTTAFAGAYNRVRQGVLRVRQERRSGRVVLATTNPAAAAKRKMARNAGKKESRKRKERGFA